VERRGRGVCAVNGREGESTERDNPGGELRLCIAKFLKVGKRGQREGGRKGHRQGKDGKKVKACVQRSGMVTGGKGGKG